MQFHAQQTAKFEFKPSVWHSTCWTAFGTVLLFWREAALTWAHFVLLAMVLTY